MRLFAFGSAPIAALLLACAPTGSPATNSHVEARAEQKLANERTKTPGKGAKTLEITDFRLATFNAGLAHGSVKHARERAPHINTALAGLSADMVCVQEVWLDQHWNELVRATGSEMPHVFRPTVRDDASASSGRCRESETRRVKECADAHRCTDRAEGDLAVCMMSHCGHLAPTLTDDCASCVLRDPTRTLKQTIQDCGAGPAQRTTSRKTAPRGAGLVYGGSYGLGLLSRVELAETDLRMFNSERVARGAIYAKVKLSARSLNVFCTHLTADAGELRRKKPGSWRAEQAAQIGALLDWIPQKVQPGEPVILMGDLNCGPELDARVEGRLPEHYARFEQIGFSNPFATVPLADCTWCFDNPLVDVASRGGRLIDHILLRGLSNPSKAQRIFDQSIELSVDGQRVASAFSDHYGVMVALQGIASD